MNVWGRSLRLHIPLKDIFLMHYLAPILNNAISRREVILTSRHFVSYPFYSYPSGIH